MIKLTILSVFIIASLMLVIPSASAAEPIITHTKSNIIVDMSDIVVDLGPDFKYKVKVSTGCDSPDSFDLFVTEWTDISTDPAVYIVSSGFKKGNDYSVTYKIKSPIGENKYFPIHCIESLGTVELTSEAVVLNEKRYVNAEFDKINRELTVSWDFGDNPDRTSCNLKTEYLTYDVLGYNATSDFLGVNYERTSYLHFLGYDWENTEDDYVAISNSPETLVDCADSFTMDIIETDMFSSFFTFTQFDKYGNKVKFELQAVIADEWSVTPKVCGELDPITEEFAYKQFVFDLDGDTDTLFDPVEGCYTRIDNPPVNDVVEEKKSSDSSYNPPPTLGVDRDGQRLVDVGFSYNGIFVNAEYYHTAYPLITTNVGDKNIVELIVYENYGINNISWVQLFLGVEKVGDSTSLSEVTGQLILSNTEFEEFIITDKQNLIQNFDVTSISPVKCKSDSDSECLKITFEYEYREAPLYNAIAVGLMDVQRSSWTHYFNDGVEVIGESMNEPPTDRKFVNTTNQGEKLWLELTQTDKVNDIWTDQNGIEYQKSKYGQYDRITPMPEYQCNDTPLDKVMNGGDRNNCHFREKLVSMWE